MRPTVRVLEAGDIEPAIELCALDPVAHAFVSSRLVSGLLGEAGSAELWGYETDGGLEALCWVGANLVPVEAHAAAADAFAARARRVGRRSSSLLGPRDQVLRIWRGLRGAWGPARDIRPEQPLMVCEEPRVAPDERVRRTLPGELDVLFPASVAMFAEEIGYSPLGADGGSAYRAGVAEMVALGRSFVRIEGTAGGREVVFKAELGAVTGAVAQIQGVWVAPRWRGRGLAAPGVAAVVAAVRRDLSVRASLYVNEFNHRALAVYERVGFRQVGSFATVLL